MANTSNNNNTCDCPSPPGGRVQCESEQLAICRILNGEVYAECITPPKDITNIQLLSWALERITGREISLLQEEIKYEDRNILESGQYLNPVTDELVYFRLPASATT